MIAFIVILCVVILGIAYLTYGRFLARRFQVDDSRPTPAQEINDGLDYVPARPGFLLGQHFSAIAAAGPIVGPILAGIWFGWLPALLWIIVGSIFIGGVHDFSSLMASIRHRASSIGEVVRQHMSRTSHVLFLIFVWLALIYVVIAFTDITAQTFKTVTETEVFGPGVAASSVLYILAAMAMGVLMYRFGLKSGLLTAIFLPLVLGIVWIGPRLPITLLSALGSIPTKGWDVLLLGYCFLASILPMWLLLQPRGYLGGWFLYLVIAAGLIGALFGGFSIQYPAINTTGLASLVNGKLIFPILFITVACGACSGFHGIVSSGTTSKQLAREKHARPVGYGAMLLEALVAVLALGTVMILPAASAELKKDPNLIYAGGIARYLGLIGFNFNVAYPFALLAFSTFVYDTLDVCTRLARYIFQEIFGLKTRMGGIIATLVSLLVPFTVLMLTKEKGYMVAWPIFGASNQLLAGLTLLAVSVWLLKTSRKAVFALIPMAFMLVMTLWSLVLLTLPFLRGVFHGAALQPDAIISGVFGVVLLGLALWLVVEAVAVLVLKKRQLKPSERVAG